MGLGTHVQPLMPRVREVRELTSSMVDQLDPATQAAVLQGFSDALSPIFMVGAAVAAVACLASTRLIEMPLGPSASSPRQGQETPAE
jgi:hypothetical protein